MVWFKLRKGESVMNEKISENTYTLHNQVEIPCVGFGTWQVPDGETAANAVMHAIEAGYTHIDTAVYITMKSESVQESGCRGQRVKSCLLQASSGMMSGDMMRL